MPISPPKPPRRQRRHVSYGNKPGTQIADPTPAEIRLRCREVEQMRLALAEQTQRIERSRQDRIVRFIRLHGPQTSRAIELATRSTASHVQRDLQTLAQASRVVHLGGGTSRLYAIAAEDADDHQIGMQATSAILQSFRDRAETLFDSRIA